MDNADSPKTTENLATTITRVSKKGLPPVHSWNPDFCGDIEIRIARNGDWFYQDSIFTRHALVKLFSTVLRKDADDYYLVTPVEKLRIQVEDAPFVITRADFKQIEGQRCLQVETNTGDIVVVDKTHPLWVVVDPNSGEPSPYILVRDRLDAFVSRSVFYQLVDQAEERQFEGSSQLGLHSAGEFFELGDLD